MKTPSLLAATLLCLFSMAASAPEPVKLPSLTLGARTYTAVTLKVKDVSHASLIHSGGATTVALSDLPKSISQQLGYDPAAAAAAAATAKLQAARARNAALLAPRALTFDLTVTAILKNGLIGTRPYAGEVFILTPTKDKGYLSDSSYKFTVLRDGVYSANLLAIPRYKPLATVLEDLDASRHVLTQAEANKWP